jgi:hypothetical protein
MRQHGHPVVETRGQQPGLVEDRCDSVGQVRQGVEDGGVDKVLACGVSGRQRKGQGVHGTDAPAAAQAVLGLYFVDQWFQRFQIALEPAAEQDGVVLQQSVGRGKHGYLSAYCRWADPSVVHDGGGTLGACPARCLVTAVGV